MWSNFFGSILLLHLVLISGQSLHYLRNQVVSGAPTQSPVKKNVFISRGWGASGMPLAQPQDPHAAAPYHHYKGQERNNNGVPQWTNSRGRNRPKTKFMQQLLSPERNYSIPQLFVSYGWGPMG